jgi:RNase P/RNase MRP subunit POP5
MADPVTREELDAKLAALKCHTDHRENKIFVRTAGTAVACFLLLQVLLGILGWAGLNTIIGLGVQSAIDRQLKDREDDVAALTLEAVTNRKKIGELLTEAQGDRHALQALVAGDFFGTVEVKAANQWHQAETDGFAMMSIAEVSGAEDGRLIISDSRPAKDVHKTSLTNVSVITQRTGTRSGLVPVKRGQYFGASVYMNSSIANPAPKLFWFPILMSGATPEPPATDSRAD